jgi:N-acetylglutamate synthase-like GNAT family acetyltransferase
MGMPTPRTSNDNHETRAVRSGAIVVRPGVPDEHGQILNLLCDAKLPTEDIDFGHMDFLVAVEKATVIGTVGLEIIGDKALFRSLAVQSTHRSYGIGRQLCAAILEHARVRRVRDVYLLTTDAVNFFEKFGFKTLERKDLPDQICQTTQCLSLTCSTAASMYLPITQVP